MELHESYKYFALYGALVSWICGAWLTVRTRHENKKTTSELATTGRANYFIFAIGLSASAILLALCAFGYVRHELTLPGVFYKLLSIALMLQFVTAWVPDTNGWRHQVHYFSAWIMSYLLLSLGALLLVEDDFSNVFIHFQTFGIGMLVAMATVGTYAGRPGATNKQFLRSQQLYFFLFQILLLVRIHG